MIGVVFGTTGELIKLAPVLVALRDRGHPAFLMTTGQQVQQLPTMLEDFGLPQPDLWFARGNGGHDLESPRDIPGWLAQVGRRYAPLRRSLRGRLAADGQAPLLLVHGDTMTTVLGSLMGRASRVRVAHLEAGLRSGSWRNPFPEELDRRITSRLANMHLAPGPWAAGNLRRAGAGGVIIDTGANTVRDALDVVDQNAEIGVPLPDEPFGVVSLHRFELLENHAAFEAALTLLHEASRTTPMLFIDHPVTIAAVRGATLDHLFDDRFIRVPRQRYFNFIALLKASKFLVTDSGGSQEECAYLGHPCLIHRANTERRDGLEGSVVISRMDLDILRRFLGDWPSRVRPKETTSQRPTDRILAALASHGHLPAAGVPQPA